MPRLLEKPSFLFSHYTRTMLTCLHSLHAPSQMLREATMAYTPEKPVVAARPEPSRHPASQGRPKRSSSPPPPVRGLRHLLGPTGHSRRKTLTPDTAQHPPENIQSNSESQASSQLWVVRRAMSHAEQQQPQGQQLQGGLLADPGTDMQHLGAGWLHPEALGGLVEQLPGKPHGKDGREGLVADVRIDALPSVTHNVASVRPMLARAHICREEVGAVGSRVLVRGVCCVAGQSFRLVHRSNQPQQQRPERASCKRHLHQL